MTFAVSAAQAATICAIKDAPVRRRVLNLVNLAAHLSDAQLNDYAAAATKLNTGAAEVLMTEHGHRLNDAALSVVLPRLSTHGLVSALSGPTRPALMAAARTHLPYVVDALVDWVETGDQVASLADKPMVIDLLCHHLGALDYLLCKGAPRALVSVAQLDLQAHLVGLVEAELGTSPAVWATLAALMPSADVDTLPDLLALAKTVLADPVAPGPH